MTITIDYLGEKMHGFDYYLIRFLIEHPERRADVAEFIYKSPSDSYFGRIGKLARLNDINLYEANIITWEALICSLETPQS